MPEGYIFTALFGSIFGGKTKLFSSSAVVLLKIH